MPYPPRPTAAGLYHLAVRSTIPDPFFRDGFDRIAFVSELARTCRQVKWTCVAVCLMGTHYHLIVDADEGVLPVAMKRLNWSYAVAFNKRHGRRGHLVGGKYLSIAIVDERQLLNTYRYVVRNPVKAGQYKRPQDSPWSSYAVTIGVAEGFSFVDASCILECFGGAHDVAVERLRGFVETEWPSDVSDTFGFTRVRHEGS